MRFSTLVTIVATASSACAFGISEVSSASKEMFKSAREALPIIADRAPPSCPPIWTNVVQDLSNMFLDKTNGQCNDDARAAIRAAFHDCGTWDKTQGLTGGCDGSLVVAGEAYSRGENNGLQDISNKFKNLNIKYPSVSMADLIQVASSVAIVTCPGGPRVTTYVGRADNFSAAGNPEGRLPDVHAPGNDLFNLFLNKGFSALDLAALLGAHSTSRSFGQSDIAFGAAQDSTPGLWDVKYYQDTLTPPTPVVPFASDVSLAAHPVVGPQFKGMVNNQGKWNGKFADAMLRMSLLGVPGGVNPSKLLIDCTNVIPKGTNNKRDMRAAPINDRIR